jgi:hypothetical protein
MEEETVHIMVDRKQRVKQRNAQNKTQPPKIHPSALLPPTSSYLLIVLDPSKIVPPTGDQAFN